MLREGLKDMTLTERRLYRQSLNQVSQDKARSHVKLPVVGLGIGSSACALDGSAEPSTVND